MRTLALAVLTLAVVALIAGAIGAKVEKRCTIARERPTRSLLQKSLADTETCSWRLNWRW